MSSWGEHYDEVYARLRDRNIATTRLLRSGIERLEPGAMDELTTFAPFLTSEETPGGDIGNTR